MELNLAKIQELRDALRTKLPEIERGNVSNETMSACLSILSEATAIRIAQEIQRLRRSSIQGHEMVALMGELTKGYQNAIAKVALKYVPDAVIFQAFREPE